MNTKINYDTELLDIKTGEIIPVQSGTKIVSPANQKRRKDYAIKESQKEIFKGENEAYQTTLDLRGNFFSILCSEINPLWENVSEPTLGKLVYLATFMDKNNCICFDGNWSREIVDGKETRCRVPKPMSKEDIRISLGINKKSFYYFWKECIEKELITEKEDSFYLPKDQFRFCDNSGINKKKTRMPKLFKHAIRYMYENTDEHSKRTLVHLYRLIPFINMTYNGLCLNPFEMDKNKIKPLSLGKICDILGIDRSNQSYFLKKLKKLRFIDKQGTVCSVIRYSWLYYDEDVYWITINPQFYSGYISESAMVEMVDDFREEK